MLTVIIQMYNGLTLTDFRGTAVSIPYLLDITAEEMMLIQFFFWSLITENVYLLCSHICIIRPCSSGHFFSYSAVFINDIQEIKSFFT